MTVKPIASHLRKGMTSLDISSESLLAAARSLHILRGTFAHARIQSIHPCGMARSYPLVLEQMETTFLFHFLIHWYSWIFQKQARSSCQPPDAEDCKSGAVGGARTIKIVRAGFSVVAGRVAPGRGVTRIPGAIRLRQLSDRR